MTRDDPMGRYEARRGNNPEQYRDLPRASVSDVIEQLNFNPGGLVVLDTETTGLNGFYNDILEAAAVDGHGSELACRRYGSWSEAWPEAQAVHGIAPEDVEGLPTFESDAAYWTELIGGADILVGYNLPFDVGFLACAGVDFGRTRVFDVMQHFAVIWGDWNDYWNSYTWTKLVNAAYYYGLPTEGAHGALFDASTTLKVLRYSVGLR